MVVMKLCSYVGALLYGLHMPCGFGGRAGFDVNRSHVFPQGVLAAITLLGGGARDGARCEPALPLCSVALTTLLQVGMGSKMLEQKP